MARSLLGGTFNPPHVGHLLCAQEALGQLGLDRVLLVPVFMPPHKQVAGRPGREARLELCRLAVGGRRAASRSRDLEVDRRVRPTRSIPCGDSHARRPEDDLTFIVGGDVAQGLPAWREPAEVPRARRAGRRRARGRQRGRCSGAPRPLPGAAARVAFFYMPRIDLSSSLIRAPRRRGRPLRYLVPDAVAGYIAAPRGCTADPGATRE